LAARSHYGGEPINARGQGGLRLLLLSSRLDAPGSPVPPLQILLSIEMSSACSATIFVKRPFSCSNAFSRCASSYFNAPYLIGQR